MPRHCHPAIRQGPPWCLRRCHWLAAHQMPWVPWALAPSGWASFSPTPPFFFLVFFSSAPPVSPAFRGSGPGCPGPWRCVVGLCFPCSVCSVLRFAPPGDGRDTWGGGGTRAWRERQVGVCVVSALEVLGGGRALQQPPNAAHAERAISKHPPPPPSTRCPRTPQGQGLRPARREVPATGVATGPWPANRARGSPRRMEM